MTLTFLTPIILFVVGICAAFYALAGYKAGLVKSAISLALHVAAAFLSAGLAVFTAVIFQNSINNRIERMRVLADFRSSLGNYTEVVDVVIRMLASAILFVPIFICVVLVARFILSTIYKKRGMAEGEQMINYSSEEANFFERHDKLFGVLFGAVCGAFLGMVVLSPVTGALRTVSEVVGIARSVAGDEMIDQNEGFVTVERFSNDFAVVVSDVCGGGVFFDMATTVSCEGEMTRLSSEIKAIKNMDIAGTIGTLQNVGGFGDEIFTALETVADGIDEAPIIKMAAATAVRDIAESWLIGASFAGVERPVIVENKAIENFLDELLMVLSTTDSTTIIKDVQTFVALGRIITEYTDTLGDGDYTAMIQAFVEGDITDRIKNELILNPHMKPVEQAIDNIVMQAVADEISDFTKFTAEEREELFETIADVLTSTADINVAARKEIVVEEINSAMTEYGIYSSEMTADKIADILINNIAGEDGYVSIDDVRNYFDSMTGASSAE